MNVFYEVPNISDTETSIIAAALANPCVQKYLHQLANDIANGIVKTAIDMSDPNKHLLDIQKEQGKLAVLETLINVGRMTNKEVPDQSK